MLGVSSNSAKKKVFGAEVACVMRSTAARGELADCERRMYGSRALRAFCCVGSMLCVELGGKGERDGFGGEGKGVEGNE